MILIALIINILNLIGNEDFIFNNDKLITNNKKSRDKTALNKVKDTDCNLIIIVKCKKIPP